jgi:hypothetical protein
VTDWDDDDPSFLDDQPDEEDGAFDFDVRYGIEPDEPEVVAEPAPVEQETAAVDATEEDPSAPALSPEERIAAAARRNVAASSAPTRSAYSQETLL